MRAPIHHSIKNRVALIYQGKQANISRREYAATTELYTFQKPLPFLKNIKIQQRQHTLYKLGKNIQVCKNKIKIVYKSGTVK
ncbi:hypothetical protein MNBD_PLANCTO02-597 [hydrothermal vent metagenome]|uniref:Uncharacterized protein n=1 Tax=hydrothermal vent metagenome TaxID=652676 RepID=A0A3B1E2F4_9ZZZZ